MNADTLLLKVLRLREISIQRALAHHMAVTLFYAAIVNLTIGAAAYGRAPTNGSLRPHLPSVGSLFQLCWLTAPILTRLLPKRQPPRMPLKGVGLLLLARGPPCHFAAADFKALKTLFESRNRLFLTSIRTLLYFFVTLSCFQKSVAFLSVSLFWN